MDVTSQPLVLAALQIRLPKGRSAWSPAIWRESCMFHTPRKPFPPQTTILRFTLVVMFTSIAVPLPVLTAAPSHSFYTPRQWFEACCMSSDKLRLINMTESMQDAGTKATARGPSVGADSLQAISAKHRIDSSSDKNSEGDDELAAPVVRSNYWESKLSLSATKQIPLAGSTPYPLPADVTNTHPLYTHPAYIPQDPRRLSHVPHRSLVGEPGVRHGTQNQPLQDPFETAQDPDPRKWTGPEEKSRWERECEGIYYQQYTAPSKSKRGRPRLPTSKAAEAGKSKSQTKPKGEFLPHTGGTAG